MSKSTRCGLCINTINTALVLHLRCQSFYPHHKPQIQRATSTILLNLPKVWCIYREEPAAGLVRIKSVSFDVPMTFGAADRLSGYARLVPTLFGERGRWEATVELVHRGELSVPSHPRMNMIRSL